MLAIENGVYASYWKKTTAANALFSYEDMNFEGLQDDVLRLITGEELEVDTNGFNNDAENFNSKDDVLTLLIHLGYLAYDCVNGTVRIPNKEVYGEFEDLVKNPGKNKLYQLVRESDILLKETIACNERYVVDAIDRIRMSDYVQTFYNNEQALRYVVKFAYITCVDKYLKIQELPSGKGIADVVFIPKRNTTYPAMIVELKWNKADNAAIDQIRKKSTREL